MTDYSLSFSDLMLVDGFTEAVQTENKKVFEAILFANGMDLTMGYDVETTTHRNLRNQVWTGPRVTAQERIDAEWLATGAASTAAQIEAIKDPHLRHELRKMGRERSYDTAFD